MIYKLHYGTTLPNYTIHNRLIRNIYRIPTHIMGVALRQFDQ